MANARKFAGIALAAALSVGCVSQSPAQSAPQPFKIKGATSGDAYTSATLKASYNNDPDQRIILAGARQTTTSAAGQVAASFSSPDATTVFAKASDGANEEPTVVIQAEVGQDEDLNMLQVNDENGDPVWGVSGTGFTDSRSGAQYDGNLTVLGDVTAGAAAVSNNFFNGYTTFQNDPDAGYAEVFAEDGPTDPIFSIYEPPAGGEDPYFSVLNDGTWYVNAVPYTPPSALPGSDSVLQSTSAGVLSWVVDGGGTVTSVGLAAPTSVFDVSGSPVTGSGTLTLTFDNQSANTVFAGPTTGGAATPAFRALVAADLPAGTTPVGANPTATVNGTATNGVATNFMRSDAAPALSNNVTPSGGTQTFTGNLTGTSTVTAGTASTTSTPLAVNGTVGNGYDGDAFDFTNRGDGAVVGPMAPSALQGWAFGGMMKVLSNGSAEYYVPLYEPTSP